LFADARVQYLELKRLVSLISGHQLFFRIDGSLATKNQLRAQSEFQRIKGKIAENINRYRWKTAPRAKLAVSLRFFDDEKNKADISKLVKFYLDALKETAFGDDRQVHYLEATVLRAPPRPRSSVVFGEVRRLTDYCRLLDYAAEADTENEEEEENSFPVLFDPSSEYWLVAKRQAEVLSWTKISQYDRPGLREYLLPTMMGRLKSANPLIFDFGTLSTDRGTDRFLRAVNERLIAFRDDESLLSRIFIPIELDVQVGNGYRQLAKDLDNIMLHVCSKIGSVLLSERAYISGYRAYLVNNLSRDSATRIQVQLLPPGAIESYSDRVEKAVEKRLEELKEEEW
jgi:Holliday junction resolvase RusA-like endonuclease